MGRACVPRYILDEKDTRTVFDCEETAITVGRAGESDIAVLDLRASREHCRIERHGDQFLLVDLGSQNGTRLNGHLVERAGLKAGDQIGVGSARIWFREAPPPEDVNLSDTLVTTAEAIGLDPGSDRLRRLQRVTMALNSELHLDPLLRIIIDHLVEISQAERGFLVLSQGEGRPLVRAVVSILASWERLGRDEKRALLPHFLETVRVARAGIAQPAVRAVRLRLPDPSPDPVPDRPAFRKRIRGGVSRTSR